MKRHDLARALACAVLLCSAAQAQTIYRIVGPDGKVTFSDKPPASADQGKVAATGVGAAAAASVAALPYELRQASSKYPVTLYSAPECGACNSGRSLLQGRGIPYAERSVVSQEDIAALQRLSGEASLPFLTIGGQRIKGYSDAEWNQYLDAAGYPRSSMLPAGYKHAAASPLVVVQKAPKVEEPRPEPRPEPPVPAGPSPSNPAGIQF